MVALAVPAFFRCESGGGTHGFRSSVTGDG